MSVYMLSTLAMATNKVTEQLALQLKSPDQALRLLMWQNY